MHIAVEGLPALGKSEFLSVLRLYYTPQLAVFSELVKDVSERQKIDLLSDRTRLGDGLWAALPEREQQIRDALTAGRIVLEESHLGVHAAYAAALGDATFLAQFRERESQILWPNRFVRFAAPVSASLARQVIRGDPRYSVPPDVLRRMAGWLDSWHARRKSIIEELNVDRPPAEIMRGLVDTLSLGYRHHQRVSVLPYLFLLGRPAAGKSELIEFLRRLPAEERARDYHLGDLRVADDFPLLWQIFVEDDLWQAVGRGRLHSRRAGENYAVADASVWPFLIGRLQDQLAQQPAAPGETVVVEFSRGGPSAYQDALALFSPALLRLAAILYLDVPFEESWRRNLARYDRAQRAGILTHSVPREEMERTYASDDWPEVGAAGFGYTAARGLRVPYGTVRNTPEPITHEDFALRFRPALGRLWDLARAR